MRFPFRLGSENPRTVTDSFELHLGSVMDEISDLRHHG